MKSKTNIIMSLLLTFFCLSLFAGNNGTETSPEILDWDSYPTYQEYISMMEKFESDYPDKVKIHDIGKSVKGRKLLVANVSDNVGVRENEPKFLWLACIHGDETYPLIHSLRMIYWLCENYSKDERATEIIDNIDLWISPAMNPDGTYSGNNSSVPPFGKYNANGVDLHTNWPYIFDVGNQPDPEPETEAYLDFVNKHMFGMAIDWHSSVECFFHPYFHISRRHPDDRWLKFVARVYADNATNDGPAGFFDDYGGIASGNGTIYEQAKGTSTDYLLYYRHCRSVIIETSTIKILPQSKLNDYWRYHKNATLAYLQEALKGILGTVTDSITGKGIQAKVFVEDHDRVQDSSWVYSDSSGGIGNYHRPIYAGYYDVTYSCEGCSSRTVRNIEVKNGSTTVVNVKLFCGNSVNVQNNNVNPFTSLNRIENVNSIKFTGPALKDDMEVQLVDVSGKTIQHYRSTKGMVSIDKGDLSTGVYLLRFDIYKTVKISVMQ